MTDIKIYLTAKKVFVSLALVLSHLMCIVIAYRFGNWNNVANSAPVEVNLLYAIPFLLGIALCVTAALICCKKIKGK